jgi:hypothetical protein
LKVIYENIVGGKRMKHCARNDVKGSCFLPLGKKSPVLVAFDAE